VHTPRSFFALQGRASRDQRQRQQQEHADQCQKQDIHRISQDVTEPELHQTNKLGLRVEKHGSIYERRCKGGVKSSLAGTIRERQLSLAEGWVGQE